MKVLSHTGNHVYIAHFQGNAIKNYLEEVSILSNQKVSVSSKISIITTFFKKENALTALQMENSNISYVNAYVETEKKWSNVDKIQLFVNQLEKTTTPYSLLVDGHDVLFLRDLEEEFIEEYEHFGKEIVYNATKNNHPNCEIDEVENRDELGEFKYLNAGVVFGKTEALLRLYKEILELTKDEEIINPWKSEQMYVRIGINRKENVTFDHQCVLFQTFSKTNKTNLGNTLIIT